MAYIKLFKAADDSEISTAPTLTNAVLFSLHANLDEVGTWQKLYALADTGYSVETTVVTPTGTTAAKWQFDSDVAGSPSGSPEAYGDPISLGTVGDTTKIYFHVRAKATSDETPVNDVSVTFVVTGDAFAA
jgi:hypothetical protein